VEARSRAATGMNGSGAMADVTGLGDAMKPSLTHSAIGGGIDSSRHTCLGTGIVSHLTPSLGAPDESAWMEAFLSRGAFTTVVASDRAPAGVGDIQG
jgi:hypothetical protein